MKQLKEQAKRVGLNVFTWSPGDGVTRYRFWPIDRVEANYDAIRPPDVYDVTCRGRKSAFEWLRGFEFACSVAKKKTQ